jgi:hypothetical protein
MAKYLISAAVLTAAMFTALTGLGIQGSKITKLEK